jgi:hypothetical protein
MLKSSPRIGFGPSNGPIDPILGADFSAAPRFLAEVGCQLLVVGHKIIPASRVAVRDLLPGQVAGEMFGMDLPSSSVERDLVNGHAPRLDHQVRRLAIALQHGLDRFIKDQRTVAGPPRLVGLSGHDV